MTHRAPTCNSRRRAYEIAIRRFTDRPVLVTCAGCARRESFHLGTRLDTHEMRVADYELSGAARSDHHVRAQRPCREVPP